MEHKFKSGDRVKLMTTADSDPSWIHVGCRGTCKQEGNSVPHVKWENGLTWAVDQDRLELVDSTPDLISNDLEKLYVVARGTFGEVRPCTVTGGKLCAFNVERSDGTSYQVLPEYKRTTFEVLIRYGVSGWSNCVSILRHQTYGQVVEFFSMIRTYCDVV